MKKVLVVFAITLTINTNNAFQGSRLIQKNHVQHQTKNQFLGNSNDEYDTQEELQNLEEYDQHNCDNAHPDKPSTMTAVLTEIFSFMIIHYISMRETARVYCHDIKEYFTDWLSSLTKA